MSRRRPGGVPEASRSYPRKGVPEASQRYPDSFLEISRRRLQASRAGGVLGKYVLERDRGGVRPGNVSFPETSQRRFGDCRDPMKAIK